MFKCEELFNVVQCLQTSRSTPMERQTPSTRRQILDLLKKRGGMTAKDLGEALGITSMAVRRHLSALERDDLISATTVRRPMGRPTYVYSLTDLADDLFPKNYPQLMIGLLEDIKALDGEEKIDALFERREERLYAAYAPRMEGKDLITRVQEVTRIFDENGNLSECEPGDRNCDCYRLTWHNCAIHKISERFPQACAHEESLLSRLLGADVTRTDHQAKGDPCCGYQIKAR
jgi:predicted ArsR family transcriptional regulator